MLALFESTPLQTVFSIKGLNVELSKGITENLEVDSKKSFTFEHVLGPKPQDIVAGRLEVI